MTFNEWMKQNRSIHKDYCNRPLKMKDLLGLLGCAWYDSRVAYIQGKIAESEALNQQTKEELDLVTAHLKHLEQCQH